MERIINGIYVDRLKRARENQKMTLKDMAKNLGYRSNMTYLYIEKGVTTPNLKTINNISRTLGNRAEYFFCLHVQDA